MNTVKFILSIAVSLGLFMTAQAANNGNPISASFDRDLNRVATTGTANRPLDADPLHHLVNVALWNAGTNEVVASFDRDLNRVATTGTASRTLDADPLQPLVNVALRNTIPAASKMAEASGTGFILIAD